MTTQELIQQEAEKRYPKSSDKVDSAWLAIDREKFIEGATFGASLNGWVSVKDRLPTKEDADEDYDSVEAWHTLLEKTETTTWKRICNLHDSGMTTFSHWRKIVKP